MNKFLLFLLLFPLTAFSQTVLKTPRMNSLLYLGAGEEQPLLVGLGGSEGGNAWSSGYWKKTRDEFIEQGYAFLALGYFRAPGTKDTLERIAIEDVHNAILAAAGDKHINPKKIAIIGGSRGADLALLLASYYPDISCVVGIVPSSVVFPGNTDHFTTSTWTFNNKELPFVPVNEAAVPFLMKRNLRGTFEAMLKDSVAAEKAVIKVEKIKGPVLLLSARRDEVVPTTPMCEAMMHRLAANHFPYYYEHMVIEGGHGEPLKHFDTILTFLGKYFPAKRKG